MIIFWVAINYKVWTEFVNRESCRQFGSHLPPIMDDLLNFNFDLQPRELPRWFLTSLYTALSAQWASTGGQVIMSKILLIV